MKNYNCDCYSDILIQEDVAIIFCEYKNKSYGFVSNITTIDKLRDYYTGLNNTLDSFCSSE